MRRAELVLKGKGPGSWSWVLGYDARADKFLDVNAQYKFDGFTFVRFGQYKQPNSFEELSSTKNNDFISKAMTTNLQGVARRMYLGKLIEHGVTETIFTTPSQQQTEDYITGRFG